MMKDGLLPEAVLVARGEITTYVIGCLRGVNRLLLEAVLVARGEITTCGEERERRRDRRDRRERRERREGLY